MTPQEIHVVMTDEVTHLTCLDGDAAEKYALGILDAVNHVREITRAPSGRVGGGASLIPEITMPSEAREWVRDIVAQAQRDE